LTGRAALLTLALAVLASCGGDDGGVGTVAPATTTSASPTNSAAATTNPPATPPPASAAADSTAPASTAPFAEGAAAVGDVLVDAPQATNLLARSGSDAFYITGRSGMVWTWTPGVELTEALDMRSLT